MANDLNVVALVGRLTRRASFATQRRRGNLSFSIAVNGEEDG